MAQTLLRLALAVALISPAWCSPTLPEYDALEDRGKTPHQKCGGQSCKIAALAGSSGKPYNPHPPTKPRGGSNAGDCCILRFNPSASSAVFQENPGLQCGAKQMMLERDEEMIEETEETADEIEERQTCREKTLIFAKGTDESGPLGESVGPALKSGLHAAEPGKWSVRGVIYNNDQFGIFCLGLPGGKKAADLLEKTANECPNTKIVMAGYSQGAMVARNGLAYGHGGERLVKGIVNFGDPFKGAPIKGFNHPIKVYCAHGDPVCHGFDDITSAHLSYVGTDTSKAVGYITNLVK